MGEPKAEKNRSIFNAFGLFVGLCVLNGVVMPRAWSQSSALANDPATLAAQAIEKGIDKPFVTSGRLVISTARSANEAEPTSYSGAYTLMGSATHIKSATTGTARFDTTREYTYDRADGSNGSFENPILIVSKSFSSGKDFESSWMDSVSLSLSGVIGANAESRRRSFLWSNGIAVTGAKVLGRWMLNQSLRYGRSFYEYDIRDDGTVNSPNSVRSTSVVYYGVSDRWSVGGSFIYDYAISFQGVGRSGQIAMASVDFLVNEKISISAGVSSERSTLEPDGQSNRIRFYAPDSAQYFVDLVLIL